MKKVSLLLILFIFLISQLSEAQERIIFSPEKEPPKSFKKDSVRASNKFIQLKDLKNGWGLRLFITSFGFGVGGFYRYQFDEEWAYQTEVELSAGKADKEFEQYDYWTGTTFTPGKINSVLLIPIQNAVTYRLFKEDIVDNFRPFVTGSVGPVITYQYPYDPNDTFSGFGHGLWKLGVTGSIGFGADFGANFTNIQGVSIKYTAHYVPDGIAILGARDNAGNIAKSQNTFVFQGFQISLNIGKMFVGN